MMENGLRHFMHMQTKSQTYRQAIPGGGEGEFAHTNRFGLFGLNEGGFHLLDVILQSHPSLSCVL